MSNIKPYKQKLTVELKDWTKLYSDKNLEELNQALNSWWSFIEIDWVLFNVFEFKKAYIDKINSIQDYILSLPKDQKIIVKDREQWLIENLGRRFKNIEEINKYIKNKVEQKQ